MHDPYHIRETTNEKKSIKMRKKLAINYYQLTKKSPSMSNLSLLWTATSWCRVSPLMGCKGGTKLHYHQYPQPCQRYRCVARHPCVMSGTEPCNQLPQPACTQHQPRHPGRPSQPLEGHGTNTRRLLVPMAWVAGRGSPRPGMWRRWYKSIGGSPSSSQSLSRGTTAAPSAPRGPLPPPPPPRCPRCRARKAVGGRKNCVTRYQTLILSRLLELS